MSGALLCSICRGCIGGSAPDVATTANRLYLQRLAVVPVVVHAGLRIAVIAMKFSWSFEFTGSNGTSNSGMGTFLGSARAAGLAFVASTSTSDQIDSTALGACEADGAHHDSGPSLVGCCWLDALYEAIEEADCFDARVCRDASTNLPQRGEWHPGNAGKLLHLGVTQSVKFGPDIRNWWEIYAHR